MTYELVDLHFIHLHSCMHTLRTHHACRMLLVIRGILGTQALLYFSQKHALTMLFVSCIHKTQQEDV